jgi:hypothetical protein
MTIIITTTTGTMIGTWIMTGIITRNIISIVALSIRRERGIEARTTMAVATGRGDWGIDFTSIIGGPDSGLRNTGILS